MYVEAGAGDYARILVVTPNCISDARGRAAGGMGFILDPLLSGSRLHAQGEEWHGKATPTQRLIQLSLLDNMKRKEVGEAAIILRW